MESIKLRLAIVMLAAFVISGWYSYQELRYLLGGTVAEAMVDRVETRSERVYRRRMGSTTRDYQQVTVHFQNRENTVESRSFRIPSDVSVVAQHPLSIQYIPTDLEMIRISGRVNWIAVVMFLGSLLAFAGMIVWVGMEANRPFGNSRVVDSDRPVRAMQPKKKKRVLKPLKPLDE